MSTRAIVSVATGTHYVKGLDRLTEWCAANGEDYVSWRDRLPPGSPTHQQVPYAFKAYALKYAADHGADVLLQADACILPVRSLEPLWERIERDGYWIGANGFTNYEWTADLAYPDLFPDTFLLGFYSAARIVNRDIPHVVAGTFGISLQHPTGRAILDEYFRLASTTKAFCGPWVNTNHPTQLDKSEGPGRGPCGPSDVRGHRHDQTALSVIAWRLGCKLTNPPDVFSYGKAGGEHDPRTILIADGSY